MLRRRTAAHGVIFYSSPLLERLGVPHAFSTRHGGVSTGAFSSLNLGNPSGSIIDSGDNIAENYRRLFEAAGCDGKLRRSVFQVHGVDVAWMNRESAGADQPCADAIACDDPACVACVRVADCVPVLLASGDGRIVAAVHAGWRGVVAGVVSAAVATLRKRIGSQNIVAAIGPSIGPGHFEVGMDVVEEFRRVFGPSAPAQLKCGGKAHVDLRAGISLQLGACGVDPDHVESTDRCTSRDGDEFFSHRRDRGITGRMAAIIACRG